MQYKNIEINFTDTGKGSAVIFLHGFLENNTIWETILPHFAKYRAINVDLLGHGKTGCIGYIHTMEDQADMIFAIVQKLKLRKVTLVGHSMGGYVALAFADLYPDYVKKIILVCSTTTADSEERKENRQRAIEVVKKNSASFIRIAIVNLFSKEQQTKHKHKIEQLVDNALKMPLQGIIAALQGMINRENREILLHFSPYSTLLINGLQDTIIPIENIREQVKNSSSELVELNCGHIPMIEEPEELTKNILNFLKK